MKHSQWLKSDDAVAMLNAVRDTAGDRKLRLLSCACCRGFPKALAEPAFVTAVETAERFADGRSTKAELKRARNAARDARHRLPDTANNGPLWAALWLAEVAASEKAFDAVIDEIERFVAEGILKPKDRPPCAALIRCVLGSPLREPVADESGQSADAVRLAEEIHESGDFSRLPRLATMLKKAGCEDQEMLKHCRVKQRHARGCWVVDQLIKRK